MCANDWAEKKSQPGEAAGCGKADEPRNASVFIVDAAIIGCTFSLDYSRCAGFSPSCTAQRSFSHAANARGAMLVERGAAVQHNIWCKAVFRVQSIVELAGGSNAFFCWFYLDKTEAQTARALPPDALASGL